MGLRIRIWIGLRIRIGLENEDQDQDGIANDERSEEQNQEWIRMGLTQSD